MAEPQPTRRRPFRFSLRTLFIVSLAIGFGFAWVGMQLHQKRRHAEAINEVAKLGGRVHFSYDKGISAWKEWLFGSYAVKSVELDLNYTQAPDSILSQIHGMNLLSLHLTSTKITDAGLADLQSSNFLESISLAGTPITDAGLSQLKKFPNLKWLNLGHTRITDRGLPNLTGMTGLLGLGLDLTQITDDGLPNLQTMDDLVLLEFTNTWVTDAGLAHLYSLAHLDKISLRQTQQVIPAGIAKLKQALPRCTIFNR